MKRKKIDDLFAACAVESKALDTLGARFKGQS